MEVEEEEGTPETPLTPPAESAADAPPQNGSSPPLDWASLGSSPIGATLWSTLEESVCQYGRVCASGPVPDCLPGLEIVGLGPVGLPLVGSQADAVRNVCSQAPYGRGEKTLIDTSVRNTWQLEPTKQFKLTNPRWPAVIKGLLPDIKSYLGLGERTKTRVSLYKLLLYQQGGFFKPHRDTEKEPGMFATLVILLPSIFTGGQLVVNHDGCRTEIDLADKSRFCFHYMVFYADCEHEILPVTSGTRLALVYNLIGRRRNPPEIPLSATVVAQDVIPQLKSWISFIRHTRRANEKKSVDKEPTIPRKLVFVLSHMYSSSGLSFDQLKNSDRALVDVMRASSNMVAQDDKSMRIDLYLATLHVSQSTTGRDGWPDDDGERPTVHLTDWVSGKDNAKRLLGDITLSLWEDNDEVHPTEYMDRIDWQTEVGGPAGNEGVTLTRWYRRAVLVVWPHEAWLDELVKLTGFDGACMTLWNNIQYTELIEKANKRKAIEQCARREPRPAKRMRKDDNEQKNRDEESESEKKEAIASDEEPISEKEEDYEGEDASFDGKQTRPLSRKQCMTVAQILVRRLHESDRNSSGVCLLANSLVKLHDIAGATIMLNELERCSGPQNRCVFASSIGLAAYCLAKGFKWHDVVMEPICSLLHKHITLALDGQVDLSDALSIVSALIMGTAQVTTYEFGYSIVSPLRTAWCHRVLHMFTSALVAESDLIRIGDVINNQRYTGPNIERRRTRDGMFVATLCACIIRLGDWTVGEQMVQCMMSRPRLYPVDNCLAYGLRILEERLKGCHPDYWQKSGRPKKASKSSYLLHNHLPTSSNWLSTLTDHCVNAMKQQPNANQVYQMYLLQLQARLNQTTKPNQTDHAP